MNIDSDRYRLFREFEMLRDCWQHTQSLWQDVVRRDFDETYWKPLDHAVLTALAALDRIAPVVSQIQQECSGRETI